MINRRQIMKAALAMSMALPALSAVPAFAQAKPKLGVLIYNIGVDPWMNVAVKTLEEKGKELGFDVTVTDGRNDVAQMSAAVDQFVIQGMDAIVIAPADPESLVGSVSKAVAAGKPVVTLSLGLADAANVTSFVTADEEGMGRRQAELVVKALGGKGNVALMTGILGTTPQLGRSKGQHEVFDKESGIKVVEEQANDWQHEKTVSLIQDWLSKYPKGELNAVVAHGPELVAAAEYAHSQGRDEVIFVALDYPEDARAAVQKGILYATINQSPALMAEIAVDTAKKALEGKEVEKKIMIDTPTITKDNVEASPAAY
jgi:ABC-type sugar transport system substrate-binding protein